MLMMKIKYNSCASCSSASVSMLGCFSVLSQFSFDKGVITTELWQVGLPVCSSSDIQGCMSYRASGLVQAYQAL
jgi:hypothetical protein